MAYAMAVFRALAAEPASFLFTTSLPESVLTVCIVNKVCLRGFPVKGDVLFYALIYNKNKYLLKRGVNGRLLVEDKINPKSRKLTPTGKMSPQEILEVLNEFKGDVMLQSGIRVFNHFLKIIEPLPLSSDEWLEQERLYYRKEPFASLGEHTHILWKKT